MLQLVNLQKFYGLYRALRIDALTLEPGIYWLHGVNGSGKSTLLKVMAGILSFEGDIVLQNHLSLKASAVAYRKRVNFAEAEPVFPPFLTGRELIGLFASAKGAVVGQEISFIESMGMQAYIGQPVGTYSTGMLKKLSLVLAFLGNPTLILLDEPFITIDAPSLTILYGWIAERYRREGTSFLLSSHQTVAYQALTGLRQMRVEEQTVKLLA
jgi:ABC-2 type transport system ATP-binding protein